MSRNIFQAILCLILATGMAFAQTTSTTGEINGTVADNTGAVLPGVTVTATNTQTGLVRTTVTTSEGQYTVALLPPGIYTVQAELAGLGAARRENVRVLLGQAANVRFNLSPQIAEEITVTAEAPLIDTTESGSTTAVTEDEISNLPLLGRDFKDLVLLTPGVSTSFGGRVSLNGARGMSTDYNIDGANANSDFFGEERGGTEAPYVFSQAAIKEFQVIRSSYSVEYSRGGGGTMNAITKSGTNDVKGELFYYHRDEEWADERDLPSGVNEFFEARNADQYGFAAGGPVVRDRLFYFVNGDFQKIEEPFNIFDFRTSSQFAALPAATRNDIVARLESLTGGPLDRQFAYDTRDNQETWLAKVDWNIANNNHFSLRWNLSDYNNFPSESSGTLSNQGDEYNTVNSYVGQLDSIFSPSMYNFALFQYSLEERPIHALTTSFPQISIGGLQNGNVFFGQRDFLPNGTDEEKFEVKDTLSWIVGDHHVKTGFNYMTVDIANLFVRDLNGDFQFSTPAQFLAGTPSRFEQGFGLSATTAFDFDQYGLFIMDSWRPTSKLTVDYGVRWDGQSTPLPVRNIYESTNPEFDDDFNSDNDNFAPRVGFAYDLGGDGRSVIRGGVGQYYNFIPAILYAQPVQHIGGLFNNWTFTCSQVTCPTFPNLLTPQELAGFDPSATLDIAIVDPDLEAQESIRGSLGYERQLGAGYSFEIEGVLAEHSKQQRFVNVNAIPTGRVYGDLIEYTTSGPGRPYPNFANVRKHVTDAEGEYKSATVGLRKIALGESNLTWLAHYTWSEAIDQDSNSRSTSTSFSWDPYNSEVSEGPADYDTTHKVVASATYELPYGFFVSGIFNWRTGQPWTHNIFYSGGAGTLTGIPRMGVNVSVFVDGNGNVIDLTEAHNSTPNEFEAFLAARGARILGRNTENQPDFMNLDMRVAKRFGLPAGLELELIAEIFNVLNETNTFITSFNQNEFTMRMSGGRFQITRNNNFGVENALDFNSPPRQYQAAVKLRF
ncbi:MAG TPA: carboxypeptidase regulatory-like domain-containing protein [Rhodothermales bacterium]|nr:carboxypeptidase regulatory-like domain-containing protein [Rhodothermales bacterium]